MKHSFEQYYQDRPLRSLVDELSDARLNVEQHREKVNALVMSLVIQYLGESLGGGTRDPHEIGQISRRRKEEMKAKRIRENSIQEMVTRALSGDMDAGRTNDDTPGLDCLMDTATTAALFKEVAFADRFEKRGDFMGLDLGSGTGILSLATAIAGRRSGAFRPFTMALEREEASVRRSKEILSKLLAPSELLVQAVDVRSSGLIGTLFQGMPLSLWISETVQDLTPAMEIKGGRLAYTGSPKDLSTVAMQVLNTVTEPYFDVLANTMEERPSFVSDVQRGVTAMFPDFVNGTFTADGKKGATLKLRTGLSPESRTRLPRLGFEFTSYEQPVHESTHDQRWFRFPSKDAL